MLNKKSLQDVSVTGKRVLTRLDLNVPLEEGKITNDKRIIAALPTIKYLIDHSAKVILVSHLGRPKSAADTQFSLAPVAARLTELLGQRVALATDVAGPDAQAKVAALENGEVMLLENVRFEPGETKNDPELAKRLASLGDILVNDAFGTAHRAHASNVGVASYIPAVAGFLMDKEITQMGTALSNPKRPLVAIMGGSKVSDKIGVIENLLNIVDTFIIGGGMAYTFFKAMGYEIGDSIVEEDKLDLALKIMDKAKEKDVLFLLPVDNLVADKFAPDANVNVADSKEMPPHWQGLDIGPNTIRLFSEAIKTAGTIIWNGPMGVFEFDAFATGTNAIARAIGDSGALSIIGGGDSVAAVTKAGLEDKMTLISTGGGATLQFLEGGELPGVTALNNK